MTFNDLEGFFVFCAALLNTRLALVHSKMEKEEDGNNLLAQTLEFKRVVGKGLDERDGIDRHAHKHV